VGEDSGASQKIGELEPSPSFYRQNNALAYAPSPYGPSSTHPSSQRTFKPFEAESSRGRA
jgi:hypothetical protein